MMRASWFNGAATTKLPPPVMIDASQVEYDEKFDDMYSVSNRSIRMDRFEQQVYRVVPELQTHSASSGSSSDSLSVHSGRGSNSRTGSALALSFTDCQPNQIDPRYGLRQPLVRTRSRSTPSSPEGFYAWRNQSNTENNQDHHLSPLEYSDMARYHRNYRNRHMEAMIPEHDRVTEQLSDSSAMNSQHRNRDRNHQSPLRAHSALAQQNSQGRQRKEYYRGPRVTPQRSYDDVMYRGSPQELDEHMYGQCEPYSAHAYPNDATYQQQQHPSNSYSGSSPLTRCSHERDVYSYSPQTPLDEQSGNNHRSQKELFQSSFLYDQQAPNQSQTLRYLDKHKPNEHQSRQEQVASNHSPVNIPATLAYRDAGSHSHPVNSPGSGRRQLPPLPGYRPSTFNRIIPSLSSGPSGSSAVSGQNPQNRNQHFPPDPQGSKANSANNTPNSTFNENNESDMHSRRYSAAAPCTSPRRRRNLFQAFCSTSPPEQPASSYATRSHQSSMEYLQPELDGSHSNYGSASGGSHPGRHPAWWKALSTQDVDDERSRRKTICSDALPNRHRRQLPSAPTPPSGIASSTDHNRRSSSTIAMNNSGSIQAHPPTASRLHSASCAPQPQLLTADLESGKFYRRSSLQPIVQYNTTATRSSVDRSPSGSEQRPRATCTSTLSQDTSVRSDFMTSSSHDSLNSTGDNTGDDISGSEATSDYKRGYKQKQSLYRQGSTSSQSVPDLKNVDNDGNHHGLNVPNNSLLTTDSSSHSALHASAGDRSNSKSPEQSKRRAHSDVTETEVNYGLGELQYAVQYFPIRKRLRVSINKLTNLTAILQQFHELNPYVRVCLMPGKQQRQQSRIVRCLKDALFNEEFFFDSITDGDIVDKTIKFQVLNHSMKGLKKDTQLGEYEKTLHAIDGLHNRKEIRLAGALKSKSMSGKKLGRLQFTTCLEIESQRLTVNVIKADSLPKIGISGHIDPMIRITLEQAGTVTKKNTRTIKNSTHPVYKEAVMFLFNIKKEVIETTALQIDVVDMSKHHTEDNVLGSVFLGIKAKDKSEQEQWKDTVSKNGKEVKATHYLKREMMSSAAMTC